jgi:hypothetical protein
LVGGSSRDSRQDAGLAVTGPFAFTPFDSDVFLVATRII